LKGIVEVVGLMKGCADVGCWGGGNSAVGLLFGIGEMDAGMDGWMGRSELTRRV